MGEIIDLDYGAVLNVIKLYIDADEVKKVFEYIVNFFNIEREFTK